MQRKNTQTLGSFDTLLICKQVIFLTGFIHDMEIFQNMQFLVIFTFINNTQVP